jgi:hypothetical protein
LRTGELDINCSVYPNPATGELHISVDHSFDHSSMQIVNVLGEIVYIAELNDGEQTISLDVSNLPQGNYWLKLNSADWNLDKMFVIQR